jgi:hypothetical protein
MRQASKAIKALEALIYLGGFVKLRYSVQSMSKALNV